MFSRNARAGDAKRIRRSHAIGKKPGLLPGHGVDHDRIVRIGWFPRELVDTRNVIESAINAPDVFGECQALERFVNPRSGTEIEEVVWSPDPNRLLTLHPAQDARLDVEIRATVGVAIVPDCWVQRLDRHTLFVRN